jgi:hypothetical protein
MGFVDGGLLGEGSERPKGAKDMLTMLPRGAYTTSRTLRGAGPGVKVLMLGMRAECGTHLHEGSAQTQILEHCVGGK